MGTCPVCKRKVGQGVVWYGKIIMCEVCMERLILFGKTTLAQFRGPVKMPQSPQQQPKHKPQMSLF